MKSLIRAVSASGYRPAVRTLALASTCISIVLASATAVAETIKLSGTGGALATMQQMSKAFTAAHPGANIAIQPYLGTSGSIKALLAGALDIAVATRPAKPEEQSAGAVSTLYAKTPFIFATSQSKPTTGFTLREIADIYAGHITAWQDGSPIRLIMRPASDSDTDATMKMSAEMRAAVASAASRKGLAVAMTDQDAANLLEKIPGAMGSTTLALIVSEKRALKPLTINGVAPSLKTLDNGSYPYHKPLYFVTAANSSPLVKQFIAFARSPAGKAILKENGQLPAEE